MSKANKNQRTIHPVSNGKKRTFQYLPNNKQNNINDNTNQETNNKNTENKNRPEIPKSKQLQSGNNNKIYSNAKHKSDQGKNFTLPDINNFT